MTRSYATIDPATGQVPTTQLPPSQGGEHPDLAAHVTLGLAGTHAHPYEATGTVATHALTPHGEAHPDLATHTGLGLAADHAHPYEASGAVATHAGLSDPHPGYLTPAEGNVAYEAAGAVTAHVAAGDPHPTYTTAAELASAVIAHEALANPHATYATDVDLTTHAATPHGGGGVWTTVIKTADESHNTSTVVADDAMLKFTTLPLTNYVIRLHADFLTNATADLKYQLVHDGTTTRVRRLVRRTATTDIAQTVTRPVAFDAAAVVLSTTGLNPWVEENIVLQVGASGGLLVLRWAQVTSNAGPTTCLEGSYLEYAIT